MSLKEINPTDIKQNPIRLIAKDWMLVTAGIPGDFNTMTASWGMIGEMWGKDVVETVIRPSRYTRQFVEREGRFTLSFYPEPFRHLLTEMGTKSGREIDKMHFPGLDVMTTPSGGVAFKGARLVIEAKVIYEDRFSPEGFRDDTILPCRYLPDASDLHHRYIGEIEHVWVDDEA